MNAVLHLVSIYMALVIGVGSGNAEAPVDFKALVAPAAEEIVEVVEAAEEEIVEVAVVEAPVEAESMPFTASEEPAAVVETPAPVVEAAPVKTAQEIVTEEAAWRGNYGRLYVYDGGVDVAVFYTDDLFSLQSYVDAWDSAAMFDWYDGNKMIADHNNQGFEGIKACHPGSYAEIVTPSGTFGYTCREIIYDGWNCGDYIAYNDYTPINTLPTDSLIMYTCNNEGTITITIWG